MSTESENWQATYRSKELIARRASSHRRKIAQVGLLRLPRDSRILDVACGSGEALRILHDEGFTHLDGLDMASDEELAREPWLQLRVGDARTLPYDAGSFDAVLCMHSLHHLGGVEAIRSALAESLRVLRPGGVVALLDHYDSPQLRAAFWGLHQPWLTPTKRLKAFRKQHEEEWPYMYDYLDAWPALVALLDALPCEERRLHKGMFFFYWTGKKRGP